MGFFWLWNPTLTDVGVEFEITPGNTIDPGELTPADVQRCLGVAGLQGDVERWEIRETRSPFFTSYSDSEDWQDRWSRAWHVVVEGDLDRVRPGELHAGLRELDDLDQGQSGFGEDVDEVLHLVRVLAVGTRYPADVERLDRTLAALKGQHLFTNYQAYDFLALERVFDPTRERA
jgi:hypothetical protein